MKYFFIAVKFSATNKSNLVKLAKKALFHRLKKS